MTTTIRDINELSGPPHHDGEKLPPFGYALILLTVCPHPLPRGVEHQNYRTYVSQSSGSVQAANKTYIMSSYSGSITELNIAEGAYVNEGDLIAHIKSTDLDMQQDSIQSQLDIYKKQKSQYEKLVKSIQDDKNYFSETDIDDQPYYYQYETYKSQVAQKAFDASPYQAAGYSDEQIKALMEQNQSEVEALYYSTLQSISASLTSVQSNIDNLQSQMDALNTGANDYYIYAPTSGVIHMDTPYKVGMVLSAGTPLATVASENSDLEVGGLRHPQRPAAAPCGRPLQDRHHRPVGVFLRHPDRHRDLHRQRCDRQLLRLLLQDDHHPGQHLRHQQQRRQGRSVQRYERHRPRGVRQADLFRIRDGSSGRSVPLSAHINAQRGTKE